jgi:NAD(P)-dependent dehydrogenase (short-subunit alcohol dehydrogenase family)
MSDRLKGKRAVVTGAGSGIGRAAALLFAREGASVLAVDRSEEAVKETFAQLLAAGGSGHAMCADVAQESEVQSIVARALTQLGGLEVFFANAGIGGGDVSVLEQSVEQLQEVLRVNLIGPFLAVKHAGAHMVAQGHGSIICTASVAGIRANAGSPAYSASKAGVISLVQTSANSFWGTGVRINAIMPGLIETGMTKPVFDYARSRGSEAKLGQLNPLQRFGHPEEIAAMALFLASDDASYVNGQAIAVDGGLSATHPVAKRRK